MSFHRSLLTLLAGHSLLFLVLSTGCNAEMTLTCTPGAVHSCPCLGADDGIQTCLDDGTFDSCQCEDMSNHDDFDAGPSDNDAHDSDTQQPNECGGDHILLFDGEPASPDDSCGSCQDGILACDGPNDLICEDASEPNACGGCMDLTEEPDTSCEKDGVNGTYQCQHSNLVVCILPGENVCGGETELEHEPGTQCDNCGIWRCTDTDIISCTDQVDLDNDPSNCGSCGHSCDSGDTCEDGLCISDPGGGGEFDCPGLDPWSQEQIDMENEVLVLTNQARAQTTICSGEPYPPAPPLTMDPLLQCAARLHSQDMVQRQFFSHINPDGENPFHRINNVGYEGGYPQGENIAGGYQTPQDAVNGWLNSTGHCTSIMNPGYKEIGIGVMEVLWTQKFGGG